MLNFGEILLACIVLTIFMIPVMVALVLATFLAKLFNAMFKPVTEPIAALGSAIFDLVPNPLENIPMFPSIKKCFGSTKNILFMGFVIVFLVFHFRSLSDVGLLLENLSLLFPGSALELVTTYEHYGSKPDLASFLVNPENYLQTIIYSLITGFFLHVACTTKAPDAKVNIFVKVLYSLLVSLFSSIVLSKLPADLFVISLPKFSLDLSSAGSFAASTDFGSLVAQLWSRLRVLMENLLKIVPTLAAVYFLSNSLSGFAASFLGGFIAICGLSLGAPEALSDPESFRYVFFLLITLAIGEVTALTFSEFVSWGAEMAFSTGDGATLFGFYNIVTLLISYFFYPFLGMGVLCIIALFADGFAFGLLLFALICLAIFSLSVFASYKILQITSGNTAVKEAGPFAVAQVLNFPIWIIYAVIF